MPKRSVATTKPIVLNSEQQAVVSARGGYYLTMAGPGVGKTTCVVLRTAELIKEGYSADQILNLSFTASAAKNLKERVEQLTGKLTFTRTAGSMTLHGLALRFAVEERESFPGQLAEFPLAPEPVANRLASESAKRYECDFRQLRSFVGLQKRLRITPGEAIKSSEQSGLPTEIKLALAYKDYEKKMVQNGVLDFDSMLSEMVRIMEKDSAVRARFQYQIVVCDEAQDCSLLDFQLLKLLSEKHKSLMCIGDPGQNIFSFRGSDASLFLGMDKMFPGTQKLYLGDNHRSTEEIVSFLKEIGPVKELSEKFTTKNGHGPVPKVIGFANPTLEAEFVVKSILGGNNEA